MKHIGVKELDIAVKELYKQVSDIKTFVDMEDEESWCKEVKNEIVGGTLQVFKCNKHYVLCEHGYYPLRNTECILVFNPQCDECRKAGEQLAKLRNVNLLCIMTFADDGISIKAEKLV